jgi:hypothetical protein
MVIPTGGITRTDGADYTRPTTASRSQPARTP